MTVFGEMVKDMAKDRENRVWEAGVRVRFLEQPEGNFPGLALVGQLGTVAEVTLSAKDFLVACDCGVVVWAKQGTVEVVEKSWRERAGWPGRAIKLGVMQKMSREEKLQMQEQYFEITDHAILRITVGTNGYQGGDGGHGGKTQVEFMMDGGGNMEVEAGEGDYSEAFCKFSLKGDSELFVMIEGMREAANRLERMAHKEPEDG